MPRRPTNVLHVRVRSPRLAWLGFLGILGRVAKLAFLAAVLVAIGWAIQQGYQRVVLDNPDFQLRVIDLNPNPVLDERGLVALTGLELTSNLARIDSTAIRETLLAHPAITEARIERHMPDTLVVRLTTREPRAWLAMPDAGIPVQRRPGALLIDAQSIAYPCPDLQFPESEKLPVIVLGHDAEQPIVPGQPVRHDSLKHCISLLDTAATHTPDLLESLNTLHQPNPWSILAITHDGIEATLGLRDQPRQLARLRAALEHSESTRRELATINLIPRENIPITLRTEVPPRAIPVLEPTEQEIIQSRQQQDLQSLINRH